ncbi:hypothetical protein R1flu_015527 [Riccia fluitans]|uniref:t-SNARE coiled-coil homology domain-containing protein n=1 Tax=Riccia fluitans TaxID=41844 RepID=A0ABD1YJ65_9MARC
METERQPEDNREAVEGDWRAGTLAGAWSFVLEFFFELVFHNWDVLARYDRNRNSLFDTLEEGGVRASSSYSTSEIAEQENDRGIESIGDRVSVLKRLTTDIHDEVDNHNWMLERMAFPTHPECSLFGPPFAEVGFGGGYTVPVSRPTILNPQEV